MAQLPSRIWLVQQIEDDIVLFHRDTEEEVARADVKDINSIARAQHHINISPALSDEDKCFAYFWFGYFYGARNSGRF